MSSNDGASGRENLNKSAQLENRLYTPDVDRAVTDAVHERFKSQLVYCDNCKEKFIGNGVSINKHFNKSHPADKFCTYCPGKVFHYYKVKNDVDKSEKYYYHRCKDWLAK